MDVEEFGEMPEVMGPLTAVDQRMAQAVICGVEAKDGEEIPWTEEAWAAVLVERERLGRPLSSDETWAIIRASGENQCLVEVDRSGSGNG